MCVCEPCPDGGVVCLVAGEIDLSNADELQEQILCGYAAHGPPLVVDLAGVTFMGLVGVDVLLRVQARLERDGAAAALLVRRTSRPVRRVLTLSGAAGLLDPPRRAVV